MRVGHVAIEELEVGVHARGGGLDAPEQRATGVGIGSPETGKFPIAFSVSPPHRDADVVVSVMRPSLERARNQGVVGFP